MPDTHPPTLVCVSSATIMSGRVLLWYLGEAAALDNRVLLSASRDGVCVHYRDVIFPDTVAWSNFLAALNSAADAARLLAFGGTQYHGAIDQFVTHEWDGRGRKTLNPFTPR